MTKARDDGSLTREEMRWWLNEEVKRVMKATDLQVRDATDFVTAFCAGKISAQEANRRMTVYDCRWGEATLIAAMSEEGRSDEEILKRLDQQQRIPPPDSATGEGTWSKRHKDTAKRHR